MPATTISPARLAANRANAQRSTGPRTEAGKARSRANAVKHGLTGAGVALAGEDAAAITAEFLRMQEEYAPTTLLGMKLVHQMALLSVRRDRARGFEAARLRVRLRHAASDFDRARAEHADRLVDAIEADPRACRRALLALPEGVDRLIAEIHLLLDDLTGPAPAWADAHHRRLDALFGFRVRDLPWNRPTRFSRALLGDFEAIGDAEVEHLADAEERRAWAIEQLLAAIDEEVARLRAHRDTLDLGRIADDRDDAVAQARFDPDRAAELARRYDLAAARELSRALRDFHLAESQGDPEPGPESEPPAVAPPDLESAAPSVPAGVAAADPPADTNPNPRRDTGLDPTLGSSGASPVATAVADPTVPPPPPGGPPGARPPAGPDGRLHPAGQPDRSLTPAGSPIPRPQPLPARRGPPPVRPERPTGMEFLGIPES